MAEMRLALSATPVPHCPEPERGHGAVADEWADDHAVMYAERDHERAGECRRGKQADTRAA